MSCTSEFVDTSLSRWLQVARENLAAHRHRPAMPDPSATIQVDPREIGRLSRYHVETKKRLGAKYHDWGRIIDGDWDLRPDGKRNPVLAEEPTHQSVWLRYVHRAPWRETPVYERQLTRIIENGVGDHGMSSQAELDERCARLDDVFAEIRAGRWRLVSFEDCLSVSIDRHGGFLLAVGGKHRLAMAQLLRLPTIEVYVMARHDRWQHTRELRQAGQLDWLEHADLADVSGPK